VFVQNPQAIYQLLGYPLVSLKAKENAQVRDKKKSEVKHSLLQVNVSKVKNTVALCLIIPRNKFIPRPNSEPIASQLAV
jgi:hypothetical protein